MVNQKRVAERVGVNRSTICRVLGSKRKIGWGLAKKLSGVFKRRKPQWWMGASLVEIRNELERIGG